MMNILAVDLDKELLEFQLQRTLSGISWSVQYVSSAEEVPVALQRCPSDLILSGVSDTGWTFFSEIRDCNPDIAFVYVESLAHEPPVLPPVEAGAGLQTVLDRLLRYSPGSFATLPTNVTDELERMGYVTYPDVTMPPPPEILSCRFAADLKAAENVALQICSVMMKMGWDIEDTTKTELLINEYCSNLIRHCKDTNVQEHLGILCAVALKPQQAKLAFYSHTGSWDLLKALEEVDSETVFEQQNTLLCGGGRGMPIIKMCSPQIDFKQHCGVSETVFTITK